MQVPRGRLTRLRAELWAPLFQRIETRGCQRPQERTTSIRLIWELQCGFRSCVDGGPSKDFRENVQTCFADLQQGRFGAVKETSGKPEPVSQTVSINAKEIKREFESEGKKEVVADVVANIAKAQTMVLAEYRGTTVADLTASPDARSKGVYLRVLKTRWPAAPWKAHRSRWPRTRWSVRSFTVFSEDAVAAAKVVADFAKGKEHFVVIKAGAFSGKALDAAGVQSLANIPSKEVLLSQIAGPHAKPMSRLARVVGALAEKKGGAVAA